MSHGTITNLTNYSCFFLYIFFFLNNMVQKQNNDKGTYLDIGAQDHDGLWVWSLFSSEFDRSLWYGLLAWKADLGDMRYMNWIELNCIYIYIYMCADILRDAFQARVWTLAWKRVLLSSLCRWYRLFWIAVVFWRTVISFCESVIIWKRPQNELERGPIYYSSYRRLTLWENLCPWIKKSKDPSPATTKAEFLFAILVV